MELPQNRQCQKCKDNLPLDKDHFRLYTEKGKKPRSSNKCIVCINEQRNEWGKKQRDEKNNPTIDPATSMFLYGRLI